MDNDIRDPRKMAMLLALRKTANSGFGGAQNLPTEPDELPPAPPAQQVAQVPMQLAEPQQKDTHGDFNLLMQQIAAKDRMNRGQK